jgi:hypothetical protein
MQEEYEDKLDIIAANMALLESEKRVKMEELLQELGLYEVNGKLMDLNVLHDTMNTPIRLRGSFLWQTEGLP